MNASSYKKELPLASLDMTDLLMQFKVMKALGYHSLFDEEFRREMRNPFRKILYYRLVSAEENMAYLSNAKVLKELADRVGFYSNPELANKVFEREQESLLADEETGAQIIAAYTEKYNEALEQRRQMGLATEPAL